MSHTRAQLISLAEALILDGRPYMAVYDSTHGLSRADMIARILTAAAVEVSKYSERLIIQDVAGAGSKIVRLGTALSNWDDTVSLVKGLKYPYDAADEDQDDYDPEYYRVEPKLFSGTPNVTALALVFYAATPAVGETIRILFRGLHELNPALAGNITVPDADVLALAQWTAGQYLVAAGAAALQFIDGTLSADIATSRISSGEFRQVGDKLISLFYEHFGVDRSAGSGAAAALVQFDTPGFEGIWNK